MREGFRRVKPKPTEEIGKKKAVTKMNTYLEIPHLWTFVNDKGLVQNTEGSHSIPTPPTK